MANVDEQFKKLDKKAERLQRESEKNSQYYSLKKSKAFLRIFLFFISISIFGSSLFFILEKSIKESFNDLFFVALIPAIAMTAFFVIGISMLFFMEKKLYGIVVTALSILITVIAAIYLSDFNRTFDNIIVLSVCLFAIVISIIVLIKAYLIKKLK